MERIKKAEEFEKTFYLLKIQKISVLELIFLLSSHSHS